MKCSFDISYFFSKVFFHYFLATIDKAVELKCYTITYVVLDLGTDFVYIRNVTL